MTRVPTTSSIPRILHQTYRDDKIPAKLATLQSSWLKHNPHWQYRFWSDNDIREFIAEHYADFLEVFDAYPHNIMRVDAFRYLLLHHHGGIYADLDFECLLPMDELLADQDILLIPEPEEHINKHKPRVRNLDYVVSNALMASVPGHPFWREVVELLKKSANNPDVLDATGPFILTYAHKDFTPTIPLANPRNFDGLLSDDHGKVGGRTEGVAQDVATDTPANIPMYARHHWAGTWWKRPLI
ncbi:MAG: glycosyltransferase, group 2 family protein, partial [Gammaproteobacteria bacterium]|nr:glycosyltransferase, group 2 family protein [Gammaproteobacteria bacterium]